MKWHWTISPWTAKAPKWGVEIRRRPRIRHSQIRLAFGRRRFTLMCVATGQARRRSPEDRP